VSPRSRFEKASVVVHGITPDDVVEKPPLGAIAAELIAFCGDRVVAGHFLSIDLGFLGREIAALRAAECTARRWTRCGSTFGWNSTATALRLASRWPRGR